MSSIVKTVTAERLPDSWRRELGAGADRLVRVEMVEMEDKRSDADVGRLLALLNGIAPVAVEGDVFAFVRSERERLDERRHSGS